MKGAKRLAVLGAAIVLAMGHGPAQAQGKPHYVIGKPYQFDGVWYEPAVDYGYNQTGVASVYPPGRTGAGTTSGEPYDENAIAGAHKTLPLPCLVRVTNLSNGKSITLRLNDRGPFVDDRIIELTPAAADALGMEKQTPAQVRIQVMTKESQALAASLGAGNDLGPTPTASITPAPTSAVKVTSLPALGEAGIQPMKPVASPAPVPATAPTASAIPLAIALPPQPATTSAVATTMPTVKPSAPVTPTAPVPAPAITPASSAAPVVPEPVSPPAVSLAPVSPAPAKITPAVSVNITNATVPAASQTAPPALIPVQVSAAPPASDATKVKPLPLDLPAQFFIQTGAFKDQSKADQLRGKLATLAPAKVVPTRLGADQFNAVLLGPITSMADAQRLLKQITGMGYADAVLIIE
ncbi:MAG TPA: septal ring lytic transglycosylase RlpA family protein [Dongiaceae bacterium]